MSALLAKQILFSQLVGTLLVWIYSHPTWGVTLGQVERTNAQAELNALAGIGIVHSNHLIRLALDFNFFIAGVYQKDSAAYKEIGEYWKSLHPLCRWGGDFKDAKGEPKPDGNHISLEHEGVK